MSLKVDLNKKEASHGLVRRFKKAVQESGILARKRKKRYKHREKSQGSKKRAALRKVKVRKKYEKLKKMGKIQTHR